MGRCVLRFWYFLPCRSKILSDIFGLRRLNLEHWLPPSECQEGFMRNAPLSNVKCYSLPSDTKPDLLRHKVVAFGNWRCHIHGRPGAAGARRGVTGCGILPPATCSTTNFHRTTSSRGFVLAPNRSGAASRRQPTKAGIWSWCAGRALAKVSVISRLESRSTPEEAAGGKTRLKNVGQELGLMPGGWKQHGSVISGVTWWQLVFPMTWLHKDFLPPASTLLRSKATAQACQQPPGRQPHLKIAAALFSLTQKRAEILRGKGGKVEVFTNLTLFIFSL